MCSTCAHNLGNFWPSLRQWSWSVRSTQLHTRSIGWHKYFGLGKSSFQISRRRAIIQKITVALSRNTFCYATTTAFVTLPIYYHLQYSQRSVQHSVHKITQNVHLMCELHVTVTLYTATCSLSDADWHFFTHQRNSCSCSFLNVCTTAQEYTGADIKSKVKQDTLGNSLVT
jgi:hypothetical protein